MIEDKLSELEKNMMITELIGLAETQRQIYDRLQGQPEFKGGLIRAYHHHEKELELLIKYQKEINEDSKPKGL